MMIGCQHVFKGTPTWEETYIAFQLARGVTNEGVIYIKLPYVVRGRQNWNSS